MEPWKNPRGWTRDVGFQIGVRRIVAASSDKMWRLLTSKEGVGIWLGKVGSMKFLKGEKYKLPDGTTGEVRVFSPGSHLRITWKPTDWGRVSIIQIRVIPKRERCIVAFHQEHLPGLDAREERRRHYMSALDSLERLILSPAGESAENEK